MTTVELRAVNSCRVMLWLVTRTTFSCQWDGLVFLALKHDCINPAHTLFPLHTCCDTRLFPWSNCSAHRCIIMRECDCIQGVGRMFKKKSPLYCSWIPSNYCNKDYSWEHWQWLHVMLPSLSLLNIVQQIVFSLKDKAGLLHCVLFHVL